MATNQTQLLGKIKDQKTTEKQASYDSLQDNLMQSGGRTGGSANANAGYLYDDAGFREELNTAQYDAFQKTEADKQAKIDEANKPKTAAQQTTTNNAQVVNPDTGVTPTANNGSMAQFSQANKPMVTESGVANKPVSQTPQKSSGQLVTDMAKNGSLDQLNQLFNLLGVGNAQTTNQTQTPTSTQTTNATPTAGTATTTGTTTQPVVPAYERKVSTRGDFVKPWGQEVNFWTALVNTRKGLDEADLAIIDQVQNDGNMANLAGLSDFAKKKLGSQNIKSWAFPSWSQAGKFNTNNNLQQDFISVLNGVTPDGKPVGGTTGLSGGGLTTTNNNQNKTPTNGGTTTTNQVTNPTQNIKQDPNASGNQAQTSQDATLQLLSMLTGLSMDQLRGASGTQTGTTPQTPPVTQPNPAPTGTGGTQNPPVQNPAMAQAQVEVPGKLQSLQASLDGAIKFGANGQANIDYGAIANVRDQAIPELIRQAASAQGLTAGSPEYQAYVQAQSKEMQGQLATLISGANQAGLSQFKKQVQDKIDADMARAKLQYENKPTTTPDGTGGPMLPPPTNPNPTSPDGTGGPMNPPKTPGTTTPDGTGGPMNPPNPDTTITQPNVKGTQKPTRKDYPTTLVDPSTFTKAELQARQKAADEKMKKDGTWVDPKDTQKYSAAIDTRVDKWAESMSAKQKADFDKLTSQEKLDLVFYVGMGIL